MIYNFHNVICFSDFLIPVRNRLGFFFKNNLQLSCLLKKCLYLCFRIKNITTKIKHYES